MMNRWLMLLASFFVLAVGEGADPDPDPDPNPDPDPDPDPDPNPDPDPDVDPDPDPDPQNTGGGSGDGRANQAVRDARRRAQDAENRARELEQTLATLRQQAGGSNAPVSEEQRLFQEEEKRLRDPNTTDMERWQINANRRIRISDQNAAAARFEASDTRDKTIFELSCSQNPRMKSVAKDVEDELQRMRGRGENAPREAIAYFILGKKVATAPAKKQASDTGTQNKGKRGTLPGARSDVSDRQRMTEHEARRRRLEGQTI